MVNVAISFCNHVSVWGPISFPCTSTKTTDCNRLSIETSVWIQLHPVKLDIKEVHKHMMPFYSLFGGDVVIFQEKRVTYVNM